MKNQIYSKDIKDWWQFASSHLFALFIDLILQPHYGPGIRLSL